MKAMLPADEDARIRDLRSFEVLDTPAERTYDEIVRLASQICGTPIAVMTLVDVDRQWFKAKVGLEIDETDRDVAFCAHAILEPTELLVVPDATQDPRFADNPLVTGDANLRFYAGAPLVTPEGHALGTLCVLDTVPRVLNDFQQNALRLLSREVMAHLALRRSLEESRRANLMLRTLAEAQSGFIIDADPSSTFTSLLDLLLQLTDSEYGFIGEVLMDAAGAPYVHILGHAITDISWDEPTSALYQEHAAHGMEFHNLHTLFGAALTTKQVVISNDPAHDERRGGLPSGHPAMHAFLGLPIYVEGQMVGLAGVANRPRGYDEALVEFLDPFVATCGTLINALRENARRRAAEERLEAQNVRLRELDALKDELLATVSHELRTPLTSILSFLEL
ncbi:MAG: GAF domain-containing protein, partial [Dehalococcoidia bacterium]